MMNDRLTTEVIGFRQWIVTEDLTLKSAGASYEWKRGTNTAKCEPMLQWDGAPPKKPCKHAPAPDCHCGLYALHAPDFWYGKDAARQNRPIFNFGGADPLYLAGLVAAWGSLEVHHAGFRAQHSKIVAIALPEGKRDAVIARAVASDYGLALVPKGELERVASEFGSTVPMSMRPEKKKRPTLDESMQALIIGNQRMMARNRSSWVSFGTTVAQANAGFSVFFDEIKEEPKPATPFEAIRKLKQPKYDPRQFQSKRKGGKR